MWRSTNFHFMSFYFLEEITFRMCTCAMQIDMQLHIALESVQVNLKFEKSLNICMQLAKWLIHLQSLNLVR